MGTEKIICSIISGAPDCDIDFLKTNVDRHSFIICADSGYVHCMNAGIQPDLILGDFDSAGQPDKVYDVIALPAEKDDTDTFYAVKYAAKKGFKQIDIFNAVGGRFDHAYSNMLCLMYCKSKSIDASISDRQNKLTFVNDKTVINNKFYKYFSVFAIGGKVSGLTIKDAYYPLNNIDISPYEQFTQSNTFKNKDVEITVKSGNLLLVQSND